MGNIWTLIALLNKIVDLANLYSKHNKNQKLKDIYKAIDYDVEKFVTDNGSRDTARVFTPDGKPPTLSDLQRGTKTK